MKFIRFDLACSGQEQLVLGPHIGCFFGKSNIFCVLTLLFAFSTLAE